MYRDINEEIYILKEKIRSKEKIAKIKEITAEELNKNKRNLEELIKRLKKEEKDVLRLEGLSLNGLFLNLVGKKDEKLDKERKEYLGIKMQYDECLSAIKELEKQIEKCNYELRDFTELRREYEELINKKQSILIETDDYKGKKLLDLNNKKDKLRLEIKEVKEAVNAGNNVIRSLEDMKSPLQSAKNWGVWDMLGGEFFSDLMKHSKINEANNLSHRVKYNLKLFKKELQDVNQFTDVEVEISSFAKFADFFFDGLFSDWFVQSKINQSLSNVEKVDNKVRSILSILKKDLSNFEYDLRKIEEEIKSLLEK